MEKQLLVTRKRRRTVKEGMDNNVTSEIQSYSALQETSEVLKQSVKKELQEYIRKNRAGLISESDVFGTLTFEVKACHVQVALKILEEKGAVLKHEPAYDSPLRRNNIVRLTFYSKNLGIINTPI